MQNEPDIIEDECRFDLQLALEEDVAAELEHFVLLARLGLRDEADQLARDVLWWHSHNFPVFAELAGFYVEDHAFKTLQQLINHAKVLDFDFRQQDEQAFLLACTAICEESSASQRLLDAMTNNICFFRQRLRDEEDHVNLPHLDPIKVQMIEMLTEYLSFRSSLTAKLVPILRAHFEHLLRRSLWWEAAKIFVIFCQNDLRQKRTGGTITTVRQAILGYGLTTTMPQATLPRTHSEQNSYVGKPQVIETSNPWMNLTKSYLGVSIMELYNFYMDSIDTQEVLHSISNDAHSNVESLNKYLAMFYIKSTFVLRAAKSKTLDRETISYSVAAQDDIIRLLRAAQGIVALSLSSRQQDEIARLAEIFQEAASQYAAGGPELARGRAMSDDPARSVAGTTDRIEPDARPRLTRGQTMPV